MRDKFLSLERLDDKWSDELERLDNFSFNAEIFNNEDFYILFEQLSVYCIFRHLSGAIEDNRYKERMRFALLVCYFIGAILESYEDIERDKIVDIVRMYSAEIEYCEENTQALINL